MTRKPGYQPSSFSPDVYEVASHREVESHDLGPVTRQPVLLPSPLSPQTNFNRPLGGPINIKHLPSLPDIPSIKGPTLTPPFLKLRKFRSASNLVTTNLIGGVNSQCGVTPAFGETRIMGGEEARLGQFPWVAYLSIKGQGLDKMCGGSLISSRLVVMSVLVSPCDFVMLQARPDCRPLCRLLYDEWRRQC